MKLLHETVSRHALERPGAAAVVSSGRAISYRELDDRSNQLARVLQQTGCRTGDRIGLLLPKSIEAIIAMLGALKAGCIYVPMDTRSPAARLRKIVDSCRPVCLLAAGEGETLAETLAADADAAPVIGWLDASGRDAPQGTAFRWADLRSASAAPLHNEACPGSPAHILFTSGSTGAPKGVVITHANVIHFLNWAAGYFGIGPDDRNSGHAPLYFDLSTFDIYGTFLAGAQLHLAPPETNLLPHALARFIRSSGLTQWFSVPSVLNYMAQFDAVRQDDFPSLRRVMWCGEALPARTLMYWMRRLPKVKFTNLYGPTETTIASSYYAVPRCPESETEPIPIGVPCEGEVLMVLDEALRPVPPGEIGDLYIGGAGLSPGYWNDPARTAANFLHTEYGRIYRTGDLARVGPDGLFYLLGRTDSQIKSRGYRIELGEVEAALLSLHEIAECAVVAVPSGGFDGTAICCAYVASPGADHLDSSTIRARLAALLPSYMLPARWLRLDALPLNANGKIDRPRVREKFESLATTA